MSTDVNGAGRCGSNFTARSNNELTLDEFAKRDNDSINNTISSINSTMRSIK